MSETVRVCRTCDAQLPEIDMANRCVACMAADDPETDVWALRELANAALAGMVDSDWGRLTDGLWATEELSEKNSASVVHGDGDGFMEVFGGVMGCHDPVAYAAYVAATPPDVVLELLTQAEQLWPALTLAQTAVGLLHDAAKGDDARRIVEAVQAQIEKALLLGPVGKPPPVAPPVDEPVTPPVTSLESEVSKPAAPV